MKAPRIITLTTDFGTSDPYVGMMKGVILSLAPEATIVDLTHDVPAQDVRTGAFLLERSLRYFPPTTIHVAVVDPGVGGRRRALAVETTDGVLIGPDNGLLSLAAERAGKHTVYELNQPRWFLPDVSRTFHGRDVFAPVAAHLHRGTPLTQVGRRVDQMLGLKWPRAIVRARGSMIDGRVLLVDRFGNLVTNIDATELGLKPGPRATVKIGRKRLRGLEGSYQDVAPGKLLAYVGSYGLVEIAVRDGSAASTLRAGVGTDVMLERGAA
jgi:S-adenosylmethionine hydrolase